MDLVDYGVSKRSRRGREEFDCGVAKRSGRVWLGVEGNAIYMTFFMLKMIHHQKND